MGHMKISAALVVVVIVMGVLQMKKHSLRNLYKWRNERWAVQMAASHSQAAQAKQERMLAFTDMETSLILGQIHMEINAALVVVVIVMGVLQMKKHLLRNLNKWRNERWAVQMAASHSQAARAKQERMLAFTDMETSLILGQIHMEISAALVVAVIVMGVLQMKKHLLRNLNQWRNKNCPVTARVVVIICEKTEAMRRLLLRRKKRHGESTLLRYLRRFVLIIQIVHNFDRERDEFSSWMR